MNLHTSMRRARALKRHSFCNTVHVSFKAGFTISFQKERCQVTAKATEEELSVIEISPKGWSMDFPKLDDGLTAEGLLA